MAIARRSPFEEDELDDFESSIFTTPGTGGQQKPTLAQTIDRTKPSLGAMAGLDEPTYGVPRVPQQPQAGGPAFDQDWSSSIWSGRSSGSEMQPGSATKRAPLTGAGRTQNMASAASSAPTDFSTRYTQQTTALQQEQDPQRRAVLEDQLARQVASDLKASGHDVKWSGSQLMVDGRPYSVGGGSSYRGPAQLTTQDGQTRTLPGDQPQRASAPSTASAGGGGGAVPAGWDAGKVAAGHNTPKYAAREPLMQLSQQLQAIPDEAGRKAHAEQFLRGMIPTLEAAGAKVLDVKGEKIYLQTPDRGPHWIDAIQDIEGVAAPQWIEPGGGDVPTAAAPPIDPGTGAPAPAAPGVGDATRPSWMQAPGYEPGEIGMEGIPEFSYQYLLDQMGGYTPTAISGSDFQSTDVAPEDYATYDFEGWGDLPSMDVGAVGGQLDDLMSSILANPESLDPRTVEMLKGKSREEQAALFEQNEDAMRGMAYDMGIESSPWFAAERLQNRRDRDAAVVGKNRDIDITAATTNAADRRSAAQLGTSYVDSKGRLQLAQRDQTFREKAEGERNKQTSVQSKQARAEYLTGLKGDNANRALEAAKVRMQADIAQNQNLFNAAKLRQDGVLGAVDAGLRRAAAVQDRLQLQEQIKQAAAELGISRDKLMADWIIAMQDDATRRHGIDTGARVDMAKLQQMTQSQREELAFRYAQLAEQARGTNLDYGLGVAGLQQQNDQWATETWLDSLGL